VADSIGPSDATSATDINNSGFVIGESSSGPFLWRGGITKPIAGLVADQEWSVTSAIALTPDLRIFARAERAGRTAYVVLTPFP
jgi:hypothetical protein